MSLNQGTYMIQMSFQKKKKKFVCSMVENEIRSKNQNKTLWKDSTIPSKMYLQVKRKQCKSIGRDN